MEPIVYALLAVLAAALIVIAILAFKLRRGAPSSSQELEEKLKRVGELSDYTARGMSELTRATGARLDGMRKDLADDLKYIADSNAQNLERIRRTVDDKLAASDGKLSEGYARIAERLEKMYESVGEMRNLSQSVEDIRRVFANVKLRGTWGEAQLDSLLGQMLSPDQYAKNVRIDPLSSMMVDFAVKLPDKNGETVLLPVDSKFPSEEFERLVSASRRGDRAAEETARKNLERAVKVQADSIAKKYIRPPATCDFALLFLPSEALYAEVIRMDGIADFLHARRVFACGPTNLGALLSVLQTGFRTASVERRSGELRLMLESFRAEFAKFTVRLDKTRKKLQEAQDAADAAGKSAALIARRLEAFGGSSAPQTPFGEDDPDEGDPE